MENNQVEVERELGWGDTISKDSEFITLQPGEYDFVVEKFERGRFDGNDKMPACNKAILSLRITSPTGVPVTVVHNLLLHTRTEWAISEFFRSIGQKVKGGQVSMNWQLVPGSKGRCKIYNDEYKGNTYNKVKNFLDPQTPAATQSYTPGQF